MNKSIYIRMNNNLAEVLFTEHENNRILNALQLTNLDLTNYIKYAVLEFTDNLLEINEQIEE